MLLPKHKIIFSLEQAISLIKNSESYSISKFEYIPDKYTFDCQYFGEKLLNYTIILKIDKKTRGEQLSTVQIINKNNTNEINIYNSKEFSELFNQILNESKIAIERIENQKFLKVFPGYNITEDRNSKIASLIELVDVSSQPKRKKFLGLF
jgi:hypothetical protein